MSKWIILASIFSYISWSCMLTPASELPDASAAELLKSIPSDVSGRFILTIRNEGPGTVRQSDIEHVVNLLEMNGASSIEIFKGLPTIIVNTNSVGLKAVAQSGRLVNIQIDRITKARETEKK